MHSVGGPSKRGQVAFGLGAVERHVADRFGDRQKQSLWAAGEAVKPVVLVKANGDFILCVDNEGEDRRLCPYRTSDRIDDKQAAEALAAICLVDSKPPDQARRKRRISRQSLGVLGCQFHEGKAGRGEGVVTGNLPRWIERDEAVADAAPDILRRQFPKISVKFRNAATKRGAVMGGAERFEAEGLAHDGVAWRR